MDTILGELKVEEVMLAHEIIYVSNDLYKEILKRFEIVKITTVSHEEFKSLTKDSSAIIRTGEYTPYANIILKCGVVF